MNTFSILHNSIFAWKGRALVAEQTLFDHWDSFCHLIIAEDEKAVKWIIAIDQGVGSGTSITNCVQYLTPLVCNCFGLDIYNIRWIEVYTHDEQTIDEVVINGFEYESIKQPKIKFVWKACQTNTRSRVEKIMEAAGQVVVDGDLLLI